MCKDMLLSPDTVDGLSKRNVRLFILRFLINQPTAAIVSDYIPMLLPAILDVCLKDLCFFISDNTITPSKNDAMDNVYNYFLRDVVFAFW
jgi:hypothetical protein